MRLSSGLLIIISVVLVSALAFASRSIMNSLILSPARVAKKGEVHRLLTAGWVHGDFGHLFFNMLSLYFFASTVEGALGTLQFVLLYVLSVVVAFVPTVLRHRRHANYHSLGASGAVSAVIFSAILLNPRLSMHLMFVPIAVPGWLFALVYLAYSAYASRQRGSNINHDAHFAGALCGLGFTALLAPEQAARGLRLLLG